jgi:hypothetical protein
VLLPPTPIRSNTMSVTGTVSSALEHPTAEKRVAGYAGLKSDELTVEDEATRQLPEL